MGTNPFLYSIFLTSVALIKEDRGNNYIASVINQNSGQRLIDEHPFNDTCVCVCVCVIVTCV